jgi:hypothetical protein
VDFRLPGATGEYVTGWRSGTVLGITPGSDWEGGRRLLIRPRHHAHQQQPRAYCRPAAGEEEDSSLKQGGGGGRDVTPAAADAPGGGRGGAAAAAGHKDGREDAGDDDLRPLWVPIVWRGRPTLPWLAPPLLVRPHYVPDEAVVLAARASKGTATPGVVIADPGSALEVLRDGAWHPCEVISIKQDPAAAAAPAASRADGGDGHGGGGGGSSSSMCVVLQTFVPPEGDGGVWRCTAAHPMRCVRGLRGLSAGVVLCDTRVSQQAAWARLPVSVHPGPAAAHTHACFAPSTP